MARIVYLDRNDIELIVHELTTRLVQNYPDPLPVFSLLGGESHGGSLLESALELPKQPYYRTVYDKAAVLLRSLIKNHPFVDGNKRAAVASTMVFLLVNGKVFLATQDELVEYALTIAKSEPDIDWHEISRWIRSRTISAKTPINEIVERFQRANPNSSITDFPNLPLGVILENP